MVLGIETCQLQGKCLTSSPKSLRFKFYYEFLNLELMIFIVSITAMQKYSTVSQLKNFPKLPGFDFQHPIWSPEHYQVTAQNKKQNKNKKTYPTPGKKKRQLLL